MCVWGSVVLRGGVGVFPVLVWVAVMPCVFEFRWTEVDWVVEMDADSVLAHVGPVTLLGHTHGHAVGVRLVLRYACVEVPTSIRAPVLLLQSSSTLHRYLTHSAL